MPINNFSIGRDLSLSLVTPTGILALSGITDYAIKPMFTDLKHKGLDGNVNHAAIPDGWEVNMKIDRTDGTLDAYFAQLEASYFAGQNVQGATLSETIQEKDGSVSQYQYTRVSLKYDDAGSWKGDSLVSVSLTGNASRRIRVS
jgi:hypothetical protein